MSFSTIQITAKGRALLAKAQTGTTINFTRIKMGDGTLTGQAIDDMADVISVKGNLLLTELKTLPGGKAKVQAKFTNQGLGAGFYWREIAVFATDPANPTTELMYCYGNAYNLADYIPAQGSQILEKIISVLTIINNATSVTATIDESLVYASVDDLIALESDLRAKVATGNGTAITISMDGISTYIAGMKVSIIALSDNGQAATTLKINSLGALPIYKPNTTTAPKIEAGKPYTLILSSDLTHFIVENRSENETSTASLKSTSWSGSAAPYSQNVTVDGVTSSNSCIVSLSQGATVAQYAAASDAQLHPYSQTANAITVYAYGDKPSIDIPISVLIIA